MYTGHLTLTVRKTCVSDWSLFSNPSNNSVRYNLFSLFRRWKPQLRCVKYLPVLSRHTELEFQLSYFISLLLLWFSFNCKPALALEYSSNSPLTIDPLYQSKGSLIAFHRPREYKSGKGAEFPRNFPATCWLSTTSSCKSTKTMMWIKPLPKITTHFIEQLWCAWCQFAYW